MLTTAGGKHEASTDQQLVVLVQRGDKNAFNLLVTRYQGRVAALLSRYVPHADIADVMQEAFIKAYRSLPSFRGESAFYTWLYRIVVNTAKNHLIAQNRRPPNTDIDAMDAENYENLHVLKDNANPENLLLSEELNRVVFSTIDSLPEELRLAITLREIDGLMYEEIANIMDCPIGTVRSRIFRARELIEAQIKLLSSS